MERSFIACLALFPGALCIAASVALAFTGVTGWGWFLALGVVMVLAVSVGGGEP